MTSPIVAIVGRTNVGKSTLFNRLAGKRLTIVGDLPGVTRDRVFALASWQERELTLVDTGGWQIKPRSALEQKVKQQVEAATAQADAIIFLTDARDGVIAGDEEIANILRAATKPVILASNKVDSATQENQLADFYHLGLGTPLAISAYHNRGISELLDAVLASLPPTTTSSVESEEAKLAIVGRPNTGKSTLLNALLGDERAIVDETPGTTRDALDALVHWHDKRLLLIDTAGIKRRGKVTAGINYYSLLRALHAINRSNVALLLIDASEFITAQDLHVAGYIIEAGKGMVLVVNKWDLIPRDQRQAFIWHMTRRLKFMPYVPVVYISAKLQQGITEVLPQALQVWQERQKRLPNAIVDTVIKQAVSSHPPPRMGSRQLRIAQAYQDESRHSVFVLRVNDPHLVHFSYQRYLENKLRQSFGFLGSPLQLVFTKARRKNGRMTKVLKT